MLISINQPAYLPWLGYFHRIAISDVHVVLDHVQFEKNSFANRNKIRTKDGWCWVTVPLLTKGRFGNLALNTIEICNLSRWAEKHWKTIQSCYSRAPYFNDHKSFFEKIYSQNWFLLIDLIKQTTTYLLSALGINTPLIFSSELDVHGSKDELILDICEKTGADTYLSGPLGKNYLREDFFLEKDIKVNYQNYSHPSYEQVFNGFEAYMTVLDLLLNYGTNSRQIILNNNAAV